MIGLRLDQFFARLANVVVDQVGSVGANRGHAQLLVQSVLFGVVGVQLILNAVRSSRQHGDALRVCPHCPRLTALSTTLAATALAICAANCGSLALAVIATS